MQELLDGEWHSLSSDKVIEILQTDIEKGLTSIEIKRRLVEFGENVISIKRGKNPLSSFLLQFKQPLVLMLIIAGSITSLLQEWVDTGVIFGVVIVNAIIGFIQEHKASKAIQALVKIVTSENIVIRNGGKARIISRDVVPGDIIQIRSGDKIPADMRLYHVRDLKIDESILTGESVSVQKQTRILPPLTNLAERKNMAYAGTLVVNGYGIGMVVSTGDNTETGKISQTMYQAEEIETPLTKKISYFSKNLLLVILALSVLTFIFGILVTQRTITELFMEVVAISVSVIPEGLPAAMTIILAVGVGYMAERKAIIRNLPAVETLGSTTIICSDKTGTITENQMTVTEIYSDGKSFDVTGTGLQPIGEIKFNQLSVDINRHNALKECLTAGLVCNDSDLIRTEDNWEAKGDPTEVALIVSAHKVNLKQTIAESLYRIDAIPFQPHLQFMATLHENARGERVIYVKGSVEKIIAMCSYQLKDIPTSKENLTESTISELHEIADQMASRGLRVLAFAKKNISNNKNKKLEISDVETNLDFLGFQAMLDPPRPQVIDSIRECQSAGIRVKMITGDHLKTAISIGEQVGLNGALYGDKKHNKIVAITGKELQQYSNDKLIEIVDKTDVFARVLSEQKFAIVKALQTKGNIVAMTGDGVNDAPALKQADVGIAMGITGTEVSKEAADIILIDDNFASIKAAVEEGRRILDTLIKFITWTLPTNFGEGLVILASIFTGLILPILPVQILWINMTTSVALGMMLIFEPKESDTMKRPPRKPDASILTRDLIIQIALVSTSILLSVYGLFWWELQEGHSIEEARTVAINTIVMIETFYLLNCRSLTKSILKMGFFSNRLIFLGIGIMILLQIIFTHLSTMNEIFQSQPIDFDSWLKIIGVSFVTFIIIEIKKSLRR
ncbi:MAG TPA: HAD-IC family P-type ATPase [Nitrososphaeraceae archaeon]|nr:HAD-IC family P-type ATPase [Nitrososphaeraceae archaeon]